MGKAASSTKVTSAKGMGSPLASGCHGASSREARRPAAESRGSTAARISVALALKRASPQGSPG
eukprot:9284189-Lingulodinium_polyedra.AAC.1